MGAESTVLVRCKRCGHEFRIGTARQCPACRTKISWFNYEKDVELVEDLSVKLDEVNQPLKVQPGKSKSENKAQSIPVRSSVDIEAAKTTHAVRSIAIFILVQVTSSVIAAVIAGIGFGMTASGSDGQGFVVFGGLIAIGGLLAAITFAWSEYSQSE